MPDRAVRASFTEDLEATEGKLLAMGAAVRRQIEAVMAALARRDARAAAAVIEADDAIDDTYLDVDRRIHELMALQTPVAKDLRLVTAMMHSNLHLERMGDLCVNIAKFIEAQHPYPPESPMLTRLYEMGDRAAEMLDTVLSAFAQRSLEIVETLVDKDEALDRLNRGMLSDLKSYAGDEEAFEWASNLLLVSRYLERLGDHTVDVGEQIAFLVTGVFREFTDASHPGGVPQ